MSVSLRPYNVGTDFKRVCDFLNTWYREENRDGNFPEPAWEYFHYHPMLDETSLGKCGIWEDGTEIVAIVHYEMYLGEAFFEVKPGYEYLKAEMLAHAEDNLCMVTPDGKRTINVFINSFDTEFEALARSCGYRRDEKQDRPMTMLDLTLPIPDNPLPEGCRMSSLDNDNDLVKLDRCLWRGFNHGDEPEETDYAGRKKMQSAPGFSKDLNMVVISGDEQYVAYTGTWFEPVNRYAYVEPVCTDPDYRRMGCASTALFEGLRRCRDLGATVAYVGSLLPLYRYMGFQHLFTCHCWTKELSTKC